MKTKAIRVGIVVLILGLVGMVAVTLAQGNPIQEAAAAYFGAGYNLITAEALYDNLNDGVESNDPTIIDIRAAEDYEISHIPGAVHADGQAFFTEETMSTLPEDGQVVIYCYTGQTAGQVVGALNTLGYDAHSLKFGILGWDIIEGAPRWNDRMSQRYPVYTRPAELGGSYELAAPLAQDAAEAANAYFGEGFKLITAGELYDNLNDGDESNDPVILDIRAVQDYERGHLPGAVNVGGGAVFDVGTLTSLPDDDQIIVYCYSGQTSGQVVGVLNMLGYDAYSLKFGMPSWSIVIETGLWNDNITMDYDTGGVGLPTTEPEPELIAEPEPELIEESEPEPEPVMSIGGVVPMVWVIGVVAIVGLVVVVLATRRR